MDQPVNEHQPYKATWRKPAGVLLILAYIIFWVIIVVGQRHWIGELPILVQAVIYLIAGIVWLIPLKPLMIWMETGRFTVPKGE